MSGTHIGGVRTAKTNKEKYGSDYYKSIGRRGGMASDKGGFKSRPDLAKIAGAKGGKNSRRGPAISDEKKLQIKCYIVDHPDATQKEIASACDTNVYMVAKMNRELKDAWSY